VCDRWVYGSYFQHFTGAELVQHEVPHERFRPEASAPKSWCPQG